MTIPAASPGRLGASYWKLFTASVISNLGDGMGSVAYPWLASAVTRNPILVALVVVAQRLPWLVFTLPAGVITDRVDRRKAMVSMDVVRGVATLVVAVAVLSQQGVLPGPDEVETVVGTNVALYVAVLVATFCLGMAEVLRDNSAQTILPAIVHPDQLEKANGRMWSVEGVTNTLIGPPLGSLLLVAAFSVPFFVDAGSFLVAAALVALIPGTFRAEADEAAPNTSDEPEPSMVAGFKRDLAEGWNWLRGHSLLWPMAIILGLMNGAGMISGATFVLFAQEVLDVGPLLFTVIGFGGAAGGLLGGNLAPQIAKRFGPGACLAVTLAGMALASLVIGIWAWWPVTLVMFGVNSFLAVLWNVITVSLRQSIIPPRLLGRVNSVYRFFAWGMIPIGSAIGGITVVLVESLADRELALRATFWVAAGVGALLFVFGRAKLTTDKIDAAKTAVAETGDGAGD